MSDRNVSLGSRRPWIRLLLWLVLTSVPTAVGAPRITEFMASNDSFLADEDGEFSDWIEIHNPESVPVSLSGYHLTDDPEKLAKWTFPAVTLNPGAYLVLFASGKNRVNPSSRLHTDFQLSADGEYLALVAPDKVTVVSSFAPSYPPQFPNVSFGTGGTPTTPVLSFFTAATPGKVNSTGTRAGPVIDVEDPPQPSSGPLKITAKVRPLNASVATVRLYYRRMFAAENSLAMTDNGSEGDAVAGDGLWTATLPAAAFGPGEMTRWRFVATDTTGTETKEPAFRDPLDSPQYFGTVAPDPGIQSLLPVFHWFTSNANGAGTTTGSRGAVYYLGEFYDNVLFSLHGQSSAGFPKKSYNLDFNRTHRFRWSTNAPRVADIDLLTNWADKSKTRHVLAYEVMRESGVPAHFAQTVRVEQNGSFFSTADFVEDGDDIYLERAGLNKEGALYKVYSNTLNKDTGDTGVSGVEKKNRKHENNNDLQALINGLDLTGTALKHYLRDHIDIPRCVNMLAASSVIRNIDMHRKNWYIYRDTGRSDEWAILPWDLDLSHGRVWNTQNTYFDNALYTDGFVVNGTSVRLVSQLFQDPDTRAMILRRIRTLTDRFLQPLPAPGTPENELYYERRLNEQLALIDPPGIVPSDARRDFEKWGSWLQGGAVVPFTNPNAQVETMAEAVELFKTVYLPARRRYIYNTQIVGKGGEIPLPQSSMNSHAFTPLVLAGTAAKAYVPTNNALGVNWIGISTLEPYNTTTWLSGVTGVGYERGTGYESLIGLNVDSRMRSNNSVFIRVEFDLPNPVPAFDRLELRMKFDDGFIAFLNGVVLASANAPVSPQWNSAATANREATASVFDVFDVSDKRSSLRPGRNILAIQGLNDSTNSSDMVVVPELHGGTMVATAAIQPTIRFGSFEASPSSGNQDAEYIQLLNTNVMAVDISDWRLIGEVEHRFTPGTVMASGGSLFVSPNVAVFRARTVSPKGNEGHFVQGGYKGHLSNLGGSLWLIDNSGATNSTMTYRGQPSSAQLYLVVSELMYHPAGDGLAEFIELMNISPSATLDLAGVRFTQGVEFDFTGSSMKTLPPGGRALVVRDLAAFNLRYGSGLPVAGVFNASALNNGGERIKLEDASNQTIREFTYDPSEPWPTGADGTGYSLVLRAPGTNPDHADPGQWRSSAFAGGSPGGTDVVPFPANPSGDADRNGYPDLVDYALGNHLGRTPIPPRLTFQSAVLGAPAELLLSYPRSIGAERAGIEVTFSTDLITWKKAGPNLTARPIQMLNDGRALVIWRVNPPLRDEPRAFLRLEISAK